VPELKSAIPTPSVLLPPLSLINSKYHFPEDTPIVPLVSSFPPLTAEAVKFPLLRVEYPLTTTLFACKGFQVQ
jgi:hypothetical protein